MQTDTYSWKAERGEDLIQDNAKQLILISRQYTVTNGWMCQWIYDLIKTGVVT